MNKKSVVGKPFSGGNRPPSANNRVIMNAATGQKIGIGGVGGVTGVNGLNVAAASIQNAGVSGMGLTNLNDPMKVISNRPGVANLTPGNPYPDVGVYGSNQNLGPNNKKINVDSNEEDERYRYLLKNGIIRRVEEEDKIIFAELP